MDRFQVHAPTQVIFGKDTESQAGRWCKYYGAHKVLVHFGGQSAKKSGLLDRVCASLEEAGLEYVLLGGVVPNPELGLIHEGIRLCREQNVDFILAVGGGSVIDSAKGIGYGLANAGEVWDFYARKRDVAACAPLGAVLTIAAAGSEMSNCSVVTNEDGWLKRGLSTDYGYCKFAIMNPEPVRGAVRTERGGADLYAACLPDGERLHGYHGAYAGALFYRTFDAAAGAYRRYRRNAAAQRYAQCKNRAQGAGEL